MHNFIQELEINNVWSIEQWEFFLRYIPVIKRQDKIKYFSYIMERITYHYDEESWSYITNINVIEEIGIDVIYETLLNGM